MNNPILVIDVAHPSRPQEAVEDELQEAMAHIRSSQVLRLLKIVHGYGASGRGGVTKTIVQNWLFRKRREVREIIPGESFDLFHPATQLMRAEVGEFPDPDLGSGNRGITLVWVQ